MLVLERRQQFETKMVSLLVKGRRIIQKTKKLSNIWHYETGKGKSTKDRNAHEHPAIFPEKLAEDHILSWSNEGDLIFDPLAGSGTTLKMACKNRRRSIGIEISEEYCDLAIERIENL